MWQSLCLDAVAASEMEMFDAPSDEPVPEFDEPENAPPPPFRLALPKPEIPVARVSLLRRARVVLEMIKFQHSIFALPFALLGGVLAAGGLPTAAQLFWIVMACIFARSAAMSSPSL